MGEVISTALEHAESDKTYRELGIVDGKCLQLSEELCSLLGRKDAIEDILGLSLHSAGEVLNGG